MSLPRRIHIIGGPGVGKTTLSRRLAGLLEAPLFELDGRAFVFTAQMGGAIDYNALYKLREDDCRSFVAANDAWVSEGSCIGPYLSLYERADLIICIDIPRRVALYRIPLRHVKAELAHNNRFPGWRRLHTFWRWSSRFYADTNPPGLNEWGSPATRACMFEYLQPHAGKAIMCRTQKDLDALVHGLALEAGRVDEIV